MVKNQIENQLTIFDIIKERNPNEPIKMPNWDDEKELFRKSKTIGEILDKIPKYLVTFKEPVFGGYKKRFVYILVIGIQLMDGIIVQIMICLISKIGKNVNGNKDCHIVGNNCN